MSWIHFVVLAFVMPAAGYGAAAAGMVDEEVGALVLVAVVAGSAGALVRHAQTNEDE